MRKRSAEQMQPRWQQHMQRLRMHMLSRPHREMQLPRQPL